MPNFNFVQNPDVISNNQQSAAGGAGGAGGATGAAMSNPEVLVNGGGGNGGGAQANGGSNDSGSGLGQGAGGNGTGTGGDGTGGLLDLFGVAGGAGTGTGGSGSGSGIGGDATGAGGGLAAAGDGGDGAAATVGSSAASGNGGAGGAGGTGGSNSADQTVNTSANLNFDGSFTDDDGFDLKGADVEDAFNQDNDGVDNSGGLINNSNVANGPQTNVGNSSETLNIADSFNTDESVTQILNNVGNDYSDNSETVTGSFNDLSQDFDIDLDDSFNTDASTTVGDIDNDLIDVDVEDVLNDLDLDGDLNLNLPL